MTADRQAQIKEAYKKWQDLLAAAGTSKLEAEDIQTILDADNEKWSTTILSWRGINYTRADLQTTQIQKRNAAENYFKDAEGLKSSYDLLVTQLNKEQKEEDERADRDAQNEFNLAHPEVVLDIEKAKITAGAQAVLDASRQTFAQKNTKYFVWLGIGVGVLLLIYGARKVFGGKIKPAAV